MRYKHDCKICKSLGEFEKYDLYFCTETSGSKTVVARFSNRPEDYISGLAIVNDNPPLAEAKKRAIEKGYLKGDKNMFGYSGKFGLSLKERAVGHGFALDMPSINRRTRRAELRNNILQEKPEYKRLSALYMIRAELKEKKRTRLLEKKKAIKGDNNEN